MDNRRDFLKKASLLAGGAGILNTLPPAIQKALAINPAPGSTWRDAEHIVLLMQENRSFDHTYGTLQGVRGFNDPRAIALPNKNPVWLQSTKNGDTYAPFRLNIKDTKATWMSSLPHAWADQVDARNNGKYDQWLEAKHSGYKDWAPMPLTMGYYTREDIPFYYSLADAFTVCDHNFCSSLTGTTPNRLFFWAGTIREKPDANVLARVWNEDADHNTMVNWTTFPERLEDWGISWKIYQNEVYVDVGFAGEEEGWLSNFGDNALEYFKQYQVKLSAGYISNLPKAIARLNNEITKTEQQLQALPAGAEEAEQIKKRLSWYRKMLAGKEADQKIFTREKYEQLSQREKNLHNKAFSTNKGDPDYHSLITHRYHDGNTEREVQIPKGDVLHQFRQDVQNGQLPTVSWIVAPENFSDHPSSAWYGAWYISEVMDIMTKNPEVWKKTIFILTYDENDGYFDHLPPFVAPHPHKAGTGKVSSGIDTSLEWVMKDQQSSDAEDLRESPIGLGYRVPMVIASPWSRGGYVCSEIFDHTSSLLFLEKFLSHKTGKKIQEPNINQWRRTVCGDLTSVFRPYNGETIQTPEFVQREAFVESIHKAKFKEVPSNYKKLTTEEMRLVRQNPTSTAFLPEQEKGTRSACALPYELYADGVLSDDKKTFGLKLKAGEEKIGAKAAGSAFHVYAPGVFRGQAVQTWAYAVAAGDQLKDAWTLTDFENDTYHLQVYGPNGFFREFMGNSNDPGVDIDCGYQQGSSRRKQGMEKVILIFRNRTKETIEIEITDNAYKKPGITKNIMANLSMPPLVIDLADSYGWYDFTIRVKGNTTFMKRYAGHVETGMESKTDPAMGRVV